MHVEFDPNQINWKVVLAQPYSGRGLRYVGFTDRRGAGLGDVFGRLFSFLLPVAKDVAKNVGREALQTGSQILSDIAEDPSGNVGKILKTRGMEAVKKAVARRKKKKATGTGRKTTNRRGRGVGTFKAAVHKPVKRYHIPVF
jgi:hypothetical protein